MAQRTLFEFEVELNRLVKAWADQTTAIRQFCADAGQPLPAALQPLFSEPYSNGTGNTHIAVERLERTPEKKQESRPLLRAMVKGSAHATATHITYQVPPMPDYGPRPEEAGPDWKAVPLASASTFNLILYIIKQAGGAAPSSTINAKLPILRPVTGPSTVSMTLNTLQMEEKIGGNYREWRLTQPDVPIVISGKRMWCALDQLRQSDRAALRREVIIDALKINPRMTVSVIVDCLRHCEWMAGVAAVPDMVKGDMRILDRDGVAEKEGAFWKLKD
jgi:hypothetical protein